MSTYKEKLDYTEETKNLIKTAITNKGVAVGEGDTFRSYADKIDSIPAARPMGSIKIKTKDVKDWNNFADSIESIDWSDFNKAGVTSMYQMFNSWQGKTLDIANLSTTGVTDMNSMFNGCSSLASLDVSHFDTSQVTNMTYMFESDRGIKSIKGLENWDTSKVKSMNNIFHDCEKISSLDLSTWDTSQNTSSDSNYSGFICGCKNLETVTWGNNWMPNPKVTLLNYAGSSSYSASAKLSHETILDLFNKLATRDNTPELRLCTAVYDRMTADEIAIATNKGWNVVKTAF